MNINEIILFIISQLAPSAQEEERNPSSWVKSRTQNVTVRGTTYVQEHFQCMTNYGLEPSGLIATVVLNADRSQIIDHQIINLTEHADDYARMMESMFGEGIDNLRKR